MGRQRFKAGQIVWYIGPDQAAYEQGKTYTVLGYDDASDMYAILSYLDDEISLLPDDVLKPLNEEEEKMIRISDRMYEYYQDLPDISVSFGDIDEDRLNKISEMAKEDVLSSRLKRGEDEFLSESEYKLYLFSLSQESFYLKNGIDVLREPFSEERLYIYEFEAAGIIKTDEGDEYDWKAKDSIFDTVWPVHNDEFKKYLGNPAYQGYGAYPASCCWLLDRNSLLELADAFVDVFLNFDRSLLDKEQYVVIWCHWD